jgi:hypothetical protein
MKKKIEKISRHCPFKQTGPTVERTTVFSHPKNSRSFVTKILPTVSILLFSNLTPIPTAKLTKRCMAHYLTLLTVYSQKGTVVRILPEKNPIFPTSYNDYLSAHFFHRQVWHSPQTHSGLLPDICADAVARHPVRS